MAEQREIVLRVKQAPRVETLLVGGAVVGVAVGGLLLAYKLAGLAKALDPREQGKAAADREGMDKRKRSRESAEKMRAAIAANDRNGAYKWYVAARAQIMMAYQRFVEAERQKSAKEDLDAEMVALVADFTAFAPELVARANAEAKGIQKVNMASNPAWVPSWINPVTPVREIFKPPISKPPKAKAKTSGWAVAEWGDDTVTFPPQRHAPAVLMGRHRGGGGRRHGGRGRGRGFGPGPWPYPVYVDEDECPPGYHFVQLPDGRTVCAPIRTLTGRVRSDKGVPPPPPQPAPQPAPVSTVELGSEWSDGAWSLGDAIARTPGTPREIGYAPPPPPPQARAQPRPAPQPQRIRGAMTRRPLPIVGWTSGDDVVLAPSGAAMIPIRPPIPGMRMAPPRAVSVQPVTQQQVAQPPGPPGPPGPPSPPSPGETEADVSESPTDEFERPPDEPDGPVYTEAEMDEIPV